MRSPQNTATTLARSWFVRGRLVGAAAIAFAVLVVIENAVFAATGAPTYGAPIEEVLAYYAANRDAVAIASGLVALYLPLLLVFVTGLHGLVERRGGAGADWSRLALAAGATLSAIFVLVNVLQIGLALSAGGLAEPTPAFELVWQMHAAAFALALPTLGTTFIGAALAAHASGLTPAWQRLLGLVGGSLLLAAGARQPRDRRRLGADLRRAPRVRRLARLAARDRRAPRPVVTEMRAAPRSRTRARTPWRAAWSSPGLRSVVVPSLSWCMVRPESQSYQRSAWPYSGLYQLPNVGLAAWQRGRPFRPGGGKVGRRPHRGIVGRPAPRQSRTLPSAAINPQSIAFHDVLPADSLDRRRLSRLLGKPPRRTRRGP